MNLSLLAGTACNQNQVLGTSRVVPLIIFFKKPHHIRILKFHPNFFTVVRKFVEKLKVLS